MGIVPKLGHEYRRQRMGSRGMQKLNSKGLVSDWRKRWERKVCIMTSISCSLQMSESEGSSGPPAQLSLWPREVQGAHCPSP